MKKQLFTFILFAALVSCKEVITPLTNPNTNGNNGGNNGGNGNTDCTVLPFTPVTGKYAACLPELNNTTLDILTWNIENFPKTVNTVTKVAEILSTLNPDVVAFQEINSTTSFNQLVSALPGWTGVLLGSGSQRLGYVYKNSEISITPATQLFVGDNSAFPRPPLMITATHTSGKVVTLINLHLKCCDDGNSIPRRKDAAQKLKAYIDQNLSTSSVVMLGDYNEDLTQPEGNDVLVNFINDADNYKFADMTIAKCGEANWSYPKWPSHLDHMLITNELFNHATDVRTLKITTCDGEYFNAISDHYPVLLRLN